MNRKGRRPGAQVVPEIANGAFLGLAHGLPRTGVLDGVLEKRRLQQPYS